MPLRRGVLHRGVLIPFVALGLLVLVAYPAMAQAAPSDGERVLPYLATRLLPLPHLLGRGAHPARACHAATALPLALAIAVGSYYVCGFCPALWRGAGVRAPDPRPPAGGMVALDLKLGRMGSSAARLFLSEDVVRWRAVAVRRPAPLVTTAVLLLPSH